MYTKLMFLAHGYDGIHMTLVCPYFINTGMFNGVRPRLMPMLEPDYVAKRIVEGLLTNQVNVTLPVSTKFLVPLKCFLPAKLCWALMHKIIQGPQSMMMLKERKKRETSRTGITNGIYDGKLNTCHVNGEHTHPEMILRTL